MTICASFFGNIHSFQKKRDFIVLLGGFLAKGTEKSESDGRKPEVPVKSFLIFLRVPDEKRIISGKRTI
jgi:hypothetical protein